MNKDFFNLPDLPFYEDNYALRVYQILVINRELLELTGLIPPQKLLPKYCTSTEETIYQCARWVNPSNPDDGLDYAYQLIALYVDGNCSLVAIADLIVDKQYPSKVMGYTADGLAWHQFIIWGSVRYDKVEAIKKFLENHLIPQNDRLNSFNLVFRHLWQENEDKLTELYTPNYSLLRPLYDDDRGQVMRGNLKGHFEENTSKQAICEHWSNFSDRPKSTISEQLKKIFNSCSFKNDKEN